MDSYSLLRFIGKMCPPISFFERQVCQRLLPQLIQSTDHQSLEAGNGFLVTNDTTNLGYLSGLSERRYM